MLNTIMSNLLTDRIWLSKRCTQTESYNHLILSFMAKNNTNCKQPPKQIRYFQLLSRPYFFNALAPLPSRGGKVVAETAATQGFQDILIKLTPVRVILSRLKLIRACSCSLSTDMGRVNQYWVFGSIEIDSVRCFLELIAKRNHAIVQQWILPGLLIISDG